MSTSDFDSRAVKVGVVCALVALPFAIGLGALATKNELLTAVFSGSEWFAFKATVGALEITIFGVGAAVSHSRRDR